MGKVKIRNPGYPDIGVSIYMFFLFSSTPSVSLNRAFGAVCNKRKNDQHKTFRGSMSNFGRIEGPNVPFWWVLVRAAQAISREEYGLKPASRLPCLSGTRMT